ncbi:MAG: C39 family peptidase [bacterium]|nr:C39 family peptidase [bacterium]
MGRQMVLDVPYVKQPYDFGWCAAASIAMVLKWHGERISQQRVAKEMSSNKNGTHIHKLVAYLLRKGYGVEIKFWLPGLRNSARGLSGGKENPKVLKELFFGTSTEQEFRTQQMCAMMERFADNGGIISFGPPFLQDIRRELTAGRPVIFEINSNWLRKTGRVQVSHMVVVKGLKCSFGKQIDFPRVIFHDPGIRPNVSVPADEFLYACNIGFGYAIFINPPS